MSFLELLLYDDEFFRQMKRISTRGLLWISFLLLESICLYHYCQSYSTLISNQSSLLNSIVIEEDRTTVVRIQLPNHNIRNVYSNERIFAPDTNSTYAYSKIPPGPDVDWDSIYVTESGYPKSTHLVDYQTAATETEIEKHDRLLVQGMQYMKSFLKADKTRIGSLKSNDAAEEQSDLGKKSKPTVCLNIYLCNRRIPYINSLLMSLTSFSNQSSENEFKRTAQVHLLNTEKRDGRMHFPYLKEKLSKMSFVHKVHNITYPDEIYSHITHRELDFRETFISDTISGLKICIESGLPYCVMMEEDAIVPVDFMSLLLKQVIQPLEKRGTFNSEDGTGEISVLSLYSYYNLVFFGPHRLHYSRYSKNKYKEDRAKVNIERWGMNMLPYQARFKVTEKNYKYGTVAMLYTRQSAMKLVKYLQKVGVDPIHNADEFINADEYFPTVVGVKRKHVSPSLINHIGYYSERMAHVKARGMFSQLNTDSRFVYDAGHL